MSEKDLDAPAAEETRANASAGGQAMQEEKLPRRTDLHDFERAPLRTAKNLAKARLAVHGLRDSQDPSPSTFSATTHVGDQGS